MIRFEDWPALALLKVELLDAAKIDAALADFDESGVERSGEEYKEQFVYEVVFPITRLIGEGRNSTLRCACCGQPIRDSRAVALTAVVKLNWVAETDVKMRAIVCFCHKCGKQSLETLRPFIAKETRRQFEPTAQQLVELHATIVAHAAEQDNFETAARLVMTDESSAWTGAAAAQRLVAMRPSKWLSVLRAIIPDFRLTSEQRALFRTGYPASGALAQALGQNADDAALTRSFVSYLRARRTILDRLIIYAEYFRADAAAISAANYARTNVYMAHDNLVGRKVGAHG